jgi:MEMO1 family protein
LVRAPAVSGRFYPAEPEMLRREVQALLNQADQARAPAEKPPATAAIVPHAGYQYSGPTAARVFAALALPRLIVVLAPNHTGVCHADGGASLWERGAFHTPLGDVPVAEAFARALLAAEPLVGIDHDAHRAEHAVEVLLPFLQLLEPNAQIVPLVLAWDDWESCRALGDSLARLVRESGESGEPVLLVASSDLNHYEPATVSEVKDRRALDAVVGLDGEELLRRCRNERISMCGRAPAATVLAAATTLGAERAEVVDYRNSGWVSGDVQSVVGYGGVVIA